jgi:hypothetical protein
VRRYAVQAKERCHEALQRLRTSVSDSCHQALGPVTALWTHREILWHFKSQILTALAIGVLMAVLACYAEPWITTILSGLGGFVTTLAVQAGLWLRSFGRPRAQELA